MHSDGQALYHPRTGRAQPRWNRSVVSSYGNAAGPGEVPQEAHHQYDLSAFRSMTTEFLVIDNFLCLSVIFSIGVWRMIQQHVDTVDIDYTVVVIWLHEGQNGIHSHCV